MRHARAHGYPVPEVLDVNGPDLVLERIDGPTMQAALVRDPGALRRQVGVLAELHPRLHQIEAPAGIAALGTGETLVHLDLHPANVILSPSGPYVIDWANARRGHWADDVAQTIVVVWSALADESFARREIVVHEFVAELLRSFDRAVVVAHLPAAVARRLADPNVSDAERDVVRAQRISSAAHGPRSRKGKR